MHLRLLRKRHNLYLAVELASLGVPILDGCPDEFYQFSDNRIRELVMGQALAYGGEIDQSRELLPVPRQPAASVQIAVREMWFGERARNPFIAYHHGQSDFARFKTRRGAIHQME